MRCMQDDLWFRNSAEENSFHTVPCLTAVEVSA